MKIELTVEIVNDLKEIERLSKVIDEFGEKNGIHSKAVFEVNLSLEELITNTVSYGYNDGAVHKIIVSLIYSNDILEIEIRDDGLAFNPLNKGNPDTKQSIEERQIGGLGIYFVRNYVEELFYKRENEFNVLTLKKKIK